MEKFNPQNAVIGDNLKNNLDFLFKFNGKDIIGSPSGLRILDEVTDGFFGLTALTGIPGKGKTSFAIQSVMYNLLNESTPIIYVSLEVNKDMLIAKFLSNIIKVPVKDILKGNMNETESEEFLKGINLINEKEDLIVLDTKNASFNSIKESIVFLEKDFKRKNGYEKKPLVVIDYLNIFYDYGENGKQERDKNEKVAKQMSEFIALKNETSANFLIILAKNKQGYKDANMSSIKGPNDLEYGFETIISLEDVDDDFPISNFPANHKTGFRTVNTLITVVKNRWGDTKKIPVDFDKAKGTFYEP